MGKSPTAADAQLILQLYDLRREAEMRKARNWWLVTFWPRTADEFIKVATALGSQENVKKPREAARTRLPAAASTSSAGTSRSS